jgi:hypothetical protein
MGRGNFDYLSDNLLELQGPVDVPNNAAVTTIAGGTSCTARLYDTSLDSHIAPFRTYTTSDAAIGDDSLDVADGTPFRLNQLIAIETDLGYTEPHIVSSVSSNTLTLVTALAAPASAGRLVEIRQYSIDSHYFAIDNYSTWESLDRIEFTYNDGSEVSRPITWVDPDRNYIHILAPLSIAVDVGNVVKRQLGIQVITFADFGTFPTSNPVVGDPTWGFRATIQHDHADIKLGMRIRAEITMDDAGLNLRRKVVATVVNE